jgi:LacI family transcriptional regulator
MKITISDIAKQAGVSKATVSRVLNNRPEGVGADKRAQIQAILNDTGFQPSGFARGLATGVSHSIGLIIPNITNPFFPLLVRGVEDVLNHAGYSLFLCNSDGDITKEKEYVRVLMEKEVDGVILDSAVSDCDCQLVLLEDQGVPYVLLDRIIEGQTQFGVFLDNREGARLAARQLLAHDGCRLVYLNGPAEHSQSKLRQAGLEDVLMEKGMPLSSVRILQGDDSIQSGKQRINELLNTWKPNSSGEYLPFNAIFACNDLMAIGAMQALKQRNIRVPEEVELIGFDDIELAQLVEPALSTVSQPTFEMGSRSAELLLQLINGKKPRIKTVTLKPALVLRGTTRNPGS